MLRRIFGTEKAREDSALARNLRGLDSDDSRFDNTVSQSLPDLTIGPSTVQMTPDPKEKRGRRQEMRTERRKASEDSSSMVEGSLCSEPGVGQTMQVSKDSATMYSSINSLLTVPKTEVKRVPHSHAFSMKKTLSSKRNNGADSDLSDTSAASSRRNSDIVIESSSTPLPSQTTTVSVKKSEENLTAEKPTRQGVSPDPQPTSSSDKTSKRANKKSRKQRYKTVTGSELMPSVDALRNPDGAGIHSDSEGALMPPRSVPGWRSASLKGTSQGKTVEAAGVHLPKNEGTPARPTLTSTVPISRLDDYVVLLADQLDENVDIQALKLDVTSTPLPLKQEDLASYIEAATHSGKTIGSSLVNNIAILLPSSRYSSSAVASSVGQFTNMKRVCIAKGHVSFARVRDSYSYSRYMFLTADFLYVMKPKTATTFKLKKKVAIGNLWLAPGLSRSGEVSTSFVIGWPLATNYTLTFAKADQKNSWMRSLDKLMEMERMKESRREVIIQIVIEDTDVTVKKSLVVTRDVTVSQVIQKCLKELHLAEGDPDQYELCLKVKDSATPLIGHEIPLYIQLKNSQPTDRRDSRQVAAHHSDHGSNVFDHFVLRLRKSSQRNGVRHQRGRRLTLTGLFGRSKALPPHQHQQQQQQQPDVLQSTPQARLFGRSLPEVICSEDDALPKPVMDLLRRLYVQGASTAGIFRKPGNQRDLQDLKARLDAGEECNIDDISIHVASSALKSFLRDLPDCLLLSNLYCKWIDVVCIHDNSEKRENTKRLVSLLPPSNILLLRHLVCVLHHISVHSDLNQMTSVNLALCLGPTFLWPEGTVDLTSQFGSVELVARVTQMLIDDAQTILGSDTLELFRDLDDAEPIGGGGRGRAEESEDSLGSQELLMSNKRDLNQGTSLESLDSAASFDDTQSYNAVQSQMSVDSGLAVSNPLLYDDPESPTLGGGHLAPPSSSDGARYTKRQLGPKKKLHTKSELSDISEALTALDSDERPNSKMGGGVSNVRRRIHRFQASKTHSDETPNDSAADNMDSSEDERTTFEVSRASISSSEYMGGDSITGGRNSEDALSRDSLESSVLEKVTPSSEQVTQRFALDVVRETFRSERTERPLPSKTIIRLIGSTSRTDQNKTSGEEDGIRDGMGGGGGGMASDWYFTGPETQVNTRNLRSIPPRGQPPPQRGQTPRTEGALHINASRSEVTTSDSLSSVGLSSGGLSSVGLSSVVGGLRLSPSQSLRSNRPIRVLQHDLKSMKQNSLDSVVAPSGAVSVPEMEERKRSSHSSSTHSSSSSSTAFCPRLTSIHVLENAPPSSSSSGERSSRLHSLSSSCLSSSDSFSRPNDRPRTRQRSVPPRQKVDVAVEVNDSCFQRSRGVQTDDCGMVGGSVVGQANTPPRGIATVAVGADEKVCLLRKDENASAAYKGGRRYRSDLDLASNRRRSWREEGTVDGYVEEEDAQRREFTTSHPGEERAEERRNHFPFQPHETPRQLPIRKASLPREPVGNVGERMQLFDQTRAPVIIEQRVRDRRAVTVVTFGDDKSILPSKYGVHTVHQPMSLKFPVNGNPVDDALDGNQRMENKRTTGSMPFVPPFEPIRRKLSERKSNGFHNSDEATTQMPSAAASRMLAIQARSGMTSSPSFNPSTAWSNSAFSQQTVAAQRFDGQGHVLGGYQPDTPRNNNADSRVYVPLTKTERPRGKDDARRTDGLQQRLSQHRRMDSQRHPPTQQDIVDSSRWCWEDAGGRREDGIRYTGGPGISNSRPSFGTPPRNNTQTSSSQDNETRSTNQTMDEPSSGVTWSVKQLQKVFDSSKMNAATAVSRKQ